MKPFFRNRIRTVFQATRSDRGVESCVSESAWKNSVKFAFDFVPPEERTKIFRHSYVHDPEKFAYLKFIQKRRKNKVDTDHCSRVLMESALNNDELYSAKVGVKFNEAYDLEAMTNNLTLKASTELASNFTDISYLKTKFFSRYSVPLFQGDNFYLQLSLSGGYIKNLKSDQNPLKVNDNFYLKNFKGIRNLGYHYDSSKQGGGILGENLGFDRYVNFYAKISQIDSPLLSLFNIEPFIHVNAALAPNRSAKNGQTFIEKYGRASVGFGASLQLSGIAIECYYNPIVIKKENEIKSEF